MKCLKTYLICAVALTAPLFAQVQVRYAWAVGDQNSVQSFAGKWSPVTGRLTNVSVAQDNTVWGVDADDKVYRWNGASWDLMAGLLVQISVGSAQAIWGVSRGNEVWRWNAASSNFEKMPGTMRQVSVAADGAVWALDLNDNIFLWTGYGWQQFSCQVHQISAGSATNVWGVNAQNVILRYSTASGSQRWEIVNGQLKQVSIAADGEVWGINMTNDLVRWNGAGWDIQTGAGKLVQVSLGPLISAPGPFVLYPKQAWLTTGVPDPRTLGLGRDQCPAGWRLPTRAELDAVAQFAKTQAGGLASATGFAAKAGEAYVSSTPVYPDITSGSNLNAWKYWALFADTGTVAPVNLYFPSSADASDNTTAANAVTQRCTQTANQGSVQSDTGACSTQFSTAPDLRVADFSTVQALDLKRTVTVAGSRSVPAAPITVKPQGGAYISYVNSANNHAMLLEVDPTGNATGNEQDLGNAYGVGSTGTDGTNNATLLMTSEHKLEFRAGGAASTIIMDNDVAADGRTSLFSGRGVKFTRSDGSPQGGTEAMFSPLIFDRGVVVPAGGKWFASYDHYNNFNAYSNPQQQDSHTGISLTMFNADGSAPKMIIPWGTSHSLQMRMIADGNRIIHVALGDAFPKDIQASLIDAQTGTVQLVNNLFQSAKFPDTQIGLASGGPLYGIAGDAGGTSAGQLGDLLQVGCGQYALTYAVQPATFTSTNGVAGTWTSTLNEMGLLILDQNLNIVKRVMLKRGDDVEFMKTARYGKSAILVAWKAKNAADYWAMLVDVRGVLIQSPQKLPAGVKFDTNDGFVTLANGDIMWTARDGNALKLYRLPQPGTTATAPAAVPTGLSGTYKLTPQHAPGTCLDVFGAGTSPGTNVDLWTCTGGTNQSFNFTDQGNGIYQIQPSYNTGLCLDVFGAGTSPGSTIDAWTCTGGSNQKWKAISNGGNVYEFEPQNAPGFRLDVFGAASSPGTQIDVWPATGGSNQKWALVR